jgi:hypothetical protein
MHQHCLEIASGDRVIVMTAADVLAEHALYTVAEATDSNPGIALVLLGRTQDRCRRTPQRTWFTPDWDTICF